MKWKLYVLLIWAFSSTNLFAQITFEKAYRKLTAIEIAKSCDNDGHGGYIIGCGEKDVTQSFRKDAIVRLNAYGDTLWYHLFNMPQSGNLQLVRNSKDGGVYAMGVKSDSAANNSYMMWVLKLDSSGQKIWYRNYSYSNLDLEDNGNAMTINSDCTIVLSLNAHYLMSIFPSGNLKYFKVILDFSDYPEFLYKKNLILSDSIFYQQGNYGITLPARIMKSDLNGDTINSIPIVTDTGRYVLDFLKKSGSYYYTCSFSQILINGKLPFTFTKLDSVGNKVWNRFYTFITYTNNGPTVYTTLANGTNVVCVITHTNGTNPPAGNAKIFCFNDNGDSLWYKKFSPTDTTAKTEIFDVIATPDSGLLAVGQIVFSNGQQKSYIVKLDANGNLFNPLSVVEKKKETYLHVYPNPATTYTGIHYMGVEKNAMLTLTNLQGQIIYKEQLSANDARITIKTERFCAGFYMCSIAANGRLLANKKLVIVK